MGLPQAGMAPMAFMSMFTSAGASKSLAKKVWRQLEPQLSPTTIYHMLRLRDSPGSLAYVIAHIPPTLLFESLEKASPPSGQRRPPELVQLETELLAQVDTHGEWL